MEDVVRLELQVWKDHLGGRTAATVWFDDVTVGCAYRNRCNQLPHLEGISPAGLQDRANLTGDRRWREWQILPERRRAPRRGPPRRYGTSD